MHTLPSTTKSFTTNRPSIYGATRSGSYPASATFCFQESWEFCPTGIGMVICIITMPQQMRRRVILTWPVTTTTRILRHHLIPVGPMRIKRDFPSFRTMAIKAFRVTFCWHTSCHHPFPSVTTRTLSLSTTILT